ncbi:MAG: ferritin-like domain-containing protein [Chthoniobacterales bacterium]
MDKATVRKASAARPGKTLPTEGGQPARKTNADVGAISKGSGDTRANKTTSTNFPQGAVPKNFLNKLGEMHTSEKELTHALPLMVKAAKSKDLKALLRIHLTETKGHVKSLQLVADSLGQELPEKSCKPMTQLIKEGVKVIGKRLVSHEQDAALIGVGQKIEQFEISSYEPLCATAREMDYTHELAILTSILNQEKLANELLGGLAQGKGPLQAQLEQASLKQVGARPAGVGASRR